MSKVEEVTRALATDQMRRTLAAAGLEYEPGQDAFLRDFARAAIGAMREPTPEMIAEAWARLKRAHLPRLGPGPGFKEAYQAAIDAALREEGR